MSTPTPEEFRRHLLRAVEAQRRLQERIRRARPGSSEAEAAEAEAEAEVEAEAQAERQRQ